MADFITATGLVKIYQLADLEVVALQGLDLTIAQGEILALVGPSGCGKSTFLNALGGLDRPSAGQLTVGGRDLLKLSHQELTAYRRSQVGFVWQQTSRNLLPYLTARENIELLIALARPAGVTPRAWANELLEAVDMQEHAGRKLAALSGGQQQRVAIACALANRPQILLGDEPTGEVDSATAELILELFKALRARYGLTVVLVTHDAQVAAQADRVLLMRDGRLSAETVQRSAGAASGGDALAVVDRAGRLQLSAEQRARAGLGDRVRVEVVEGGVLIRPAE